MHSWDIDFFHFKEGNYCGAFVKLLEAYHCNKIAAIRYIKRYLK